MDGIEVASAATNGAATAYRGITVDFPDEAPFRVGARIVASTPVSRTFDGVVDEVAVYDQALSAAQIKTHAGVPPSTGRYIAFGDSYQSGEGADDYQAFLHSSQVRSTPKTRGALFR